MNNNSSKILGVVIAVSIIMTSLLPLAHAHQRALFEIGGKQYLFVIGSNNEPLFVDDKTQATLGATWPNATDPTNTSANGTSPITGLEGLKVEITAGNKSMISNLEPAYGEVGKYESETFYPTVATTFDYRIFGDINGTAFDVTFSCSPAGELEPNDNSTVQVSEGVVRQALLGGFGCPEERTGFPEPYVSHYQIAQQLNNTSTQ